MQHRVTERRHCAAHRAADDPTVSDLRPFDERHAGVSGQHRQKARQRKPDRECGDCERNESQSDRISEIPRNSDLCLPRATRNRRRQYRLQRKKNDAEREHRHRLCDEIRVDLLSKPEDTRDVSIAQNAQELGGTGACTEVESAGNDCPNAQGLIPSMPLCCVLRNALVARRLARRRTSRCTRSARKKHVTGPSGISARLSVVASAMEALKLVPQKAAARNMPPRPSAVPAM